MRFAVYLFAFLLTCAPPCLAQQIYQWTDADGQTHYSTKPDHPNSVAKELPALKKENIDKRITSLKRSTPDTCNPHGGIDCARGPDTDGSVFCRDGYRNAVMIFQSYCKEVRLQADFGVLMSGDGSDTLRHSPYGLEGKLAGRIPLGLTLNVRNLSGVAAEGVKASFKLRWRIVVDAAGPDKIEPFGNAEYQLLFSSVAAPPNLVELERATFSLRCSNCETVIRSQAAETGQP